MQMQDRPYQTDALSIKKTCTKCKIEKENCGGVSMNKELTRKLVTRFPVLYQGFYDSMSETCMCWGFDCNAGWFDILWMLSLAIEDELGYTKRQERSFLRKKRWSKRWNRLIYRLSPTELDRDKQERQGTGVKGDPIRWVVVEKAKGDWLRRLACRLFADHSLSTRFPKTEQPECNWFRMVAQVAVGKLQDLGLKIMVWSPYTGYAVTQVKEKFGTLRFYAPGNDRIFRLINLAETMSAETCEDCGAYGKIREGSWIRVLCDKCAAPEAKEVEA